MDPTTIHIENRILDGAYFDELPAFDTKTGLGKYTIEGGSGKSKSYRAYNFVKDDETGKIYCFVQTRKKSGAKFVAKAEVKEIGGEEKREE